MEKNIDNIYLKLLNDDYETEKEKMDYVLELMEYENKYYLYSFIINKEQSLIYDWFITESNFINYIVKSSLGYGYKRKLINEIITIGLEDVKEKDINQIKRVLK